MFPRMLKIAVPIDASNAVPSENDIVVPEIVPCIPLSILSTNSGISLYSSNTP
jgi:hypothetical protein